MAAIARQPKLSGNPEKSGTQGGEEENITVENLRVSLTFNVRIFHRRNEEKKET